MTKNILPDSLKEEIIQLLQAGKPIVVKHERRDDIIINKGESGSYNLNKFLLDTLSRLLYKNKVSRHKTGRYYGQAQGKVERNEAGQILLYYTGGSYHFEQGPRENLPVIQVDDPFQFKQNLHRMSVEFFFSMSRDEQDQCSYTSGFDNPWMEIRHPERKKFLVEGAEEFYREILKKGVQTYEKEFESSARKEKFLTSIFFAGFLEAEGIRLTISRTFFVRGCIAQDESLMLSS